MTRAAHPEHIVQRALVLRRRGYSYGEIRQLLIEEYGVTVGACTIRDWVTYHCVPRRA